MTRTRAVVLLSGGIDSTVALAWAGRQGWEAVALFLARPSGPPGERRAAEAVARALGAARFVACALPMPSDPGLTTPAGAETGATSAPEGYVPVRNLVYYAYGAAAAGTLGASRLVGGQNREDGEDFADATPGFFAALEQVLTLGTQSGGTPLRIVLPLIDRTKAQVIALGRELEAPLHLTWSCYRPGRHPCGDCRACTDRARAFREAGVPDPAFAL